MVKEIRELLREASSGAPHADGDLARVLDGGRRRVRTRRVLAIGGTTLALGAIALSSGIWMNRSSPDLAVGGMPRPEGPVMGLADARLAVEGSDYRVLTSYTNENRGAGYQRSIRGVTDDGLVLLTDNPGGGNTVRFSLLDPATGQKEWLDGLPDAGFQLPPVELSADRITLLRNPGESRNVELNDQLVMDVYDRDAHEWSTRIWSGLPWATDIWDARQGPDGRVYIRIPATEEAALEEGWSTGHDGEADYFDATSDTYDLWSVSLDDTSDVRNEDVRLGDLAFTATSMVWTDRTNGEAGMVHVRDLATGVERSFDPKNGDHCTLSGLGAWRERIMMSQHCGTYEGGVRDDRVQLLSADGDLVTTIQDSAIGGAMAGPDNRLVAITSSDRSRTGTYIYDLADDEFLRISDAVTSFELGGPAPDGGFMWQTPVNDRRGETQWVGELLD